jgi:hypothetical protein
MKIGEPGDSLSLVRVIGAMVVGAVALAGIGYLFDLIVGPAIGMSGWWTVFCTGGFILGGMIQAAREFTVPQPAERQAVAAEARAGEQAEARSATPASDTSEDASADPATGPVQASSSTPD